MKGIFLVISFILCFFAADAAQYEAKVSRSGTTVTINLRKEEGGGYVPFTYTKDVTFKITYKDLGTIANSNSSGTFNVIVPSGSPVGSNTLNSGFSDLEIIDVEQMTSAIPYATPVIPNEGAVFWNKLSNNELITWVMLLDAINNGVFPDNNSSTYTLFPNNEMTKSEVLDMANVDPNYLPSSTNEAVIKSEVVNITPKEHIYFVQMYNNIPPNPPISNVGSISLETIFYYKSSDDTRVYPSNYEIQINVNYTYAGGSGTFRVTHPHTSGSQVSTTNGYPWTGTTIEYINTPKPFDNYILDENKCVIQEQ